MDRQFIWHLARSDFAKFLLIAFEIVRPGRPLDYNWHIDAIVHVLTDPTKNARHLITMPPRSLKSFIISVAWAAYCLGHNPGMDIMVVSYSEPLAEELSNLTRTLMMSEFYQTIFPETRLTQSTSTKLKTTRNGGRFATTIAGAATGLGADMIIVDDPHNANDINFPNARQAARDAFDGTFSTRLNNPSEGKFYVVMQRLHEDDLAGHLLRQGWPQLKLPAIATEDATYDLGSQQIKQVRVGDLLHPTRLSEDVIESLRLGMGSAKFQAQYQQDPAPSDGGIIKRKWLRTYDTLPDPSDGEIVLSIDTATKTDPSSDFSVCTVWQKTQNGHYLLHVWREKVDYPMLRHKTIELKEIFNASRILIEDAGVGSALITELGQRDFPAIGRKSRDTKEARLSGSTGMIEAGQVYFPKDASWLGEFLNELIGFPSVKHDDQVDSLSQYLGWVRENQGSFFFHADFDWGGGMTHQGIAQHLLHMRA